MILALEKQQNTEQCLTLWGISWPQFEAIAGTFESIEGVRLTYFDGVLEIMTPSPDHEEYKSTLSALVESYLRERKIRFYIKGSPTLGSKEKGAQKEPDESYNIDTKKEIPDLAIEIILTSGGIDKLALYKRLGVPEVWFWEDGVLSIYHLREQGYEKIERSELLPGLDIPLLNRYITYFDQYDAVEEFIQAIRNSKESL